MHVMPEVAAQERMVDDGTGQVEVSVITNPTDRGRYMCLWFHIRSYLNSSICRAGVPKTHIVHLWAADTLSTVNISGVED